MLISLLWSQEPYTSSLFLSIYSNQIFCFLSRLHVHYFRNLIDIDCTRGLHCKLSPWENHWWPRLAAVFKGWQFLMVPSRAVNIHHIILNVISIHWLHYVYFQNYPGQVNIFACIFQMLRLSYFEPYAH